MHRKASRSANLTFLLFTLFITNEAAAPVEIPMTNGSRTIPIIAKGVTAELPCTPLTTEITVKKTTTPIMSSIAASGIKVFVTGPLV